MSQAELAAIPDIDFARQMLETDGRGPLWANAFVAKRFAELFRTLPKKDRDGVCWECYQHVKVIACRRIIAHLEVQPNG